MSSPFLSSADWYNHPTPTNSNTNLNRAANQSQPLTAPTTHSNLSNHTTNWNEHQQPLQRSSSPFTNSNGNTSMNNNNSSSTGSNVGSRVGTIGGHRASSSGPSSRKGSESPAPSSNPQPGSNSPFGLGLGSNSSTESFRQTMALNAFRNANTSSPFSQSSSSTNTKQPINDNLATEVDGHSNNRKEGSMSEASNGYVTAHSQVGSSSNESTITPGAQGGVGVGGSGGGTTAFNNDKKNDDNQHNNSRQAFASPYLTTAPYSPALSGFGTGFGSNAMLSGGGPSAGSGSGSVYNTPRLGFDTEPIGSIGSSNSNNKRLSASSNSFVDHQAQLSNKFEPRKSFPSNLGGGSTSLERKDSLGGGNSEPINHQIDSKNHHHLQLNKNLSSNHEGSLNSASTATTTQSPTSTAESFPTSNSGGGLLNNGASGADDHSSMNPNLAPNVTSIPRSNSSGSYPFPPAALGSNQSHQQSQSQQQRANSTPLLNVPLTNASSASSQGFGSLAGGLLSPTAATLGSSVGPNTTTAGPNSPSGLQSPSMGMGSGGGWQSPTPFSLGSSAVTAPNGSSEIGTGSSNAFDALARSSPLVTDILDRLVRLENSVRDVNRQMSGVVRNVSLLIDRTRHLPQQNNLSGNGPVKSPIPNQGSFPSHQQQQSQRGPPPLQQQQQQAGQRFSDMGSIQQGIQDVSMGTQNANDDFRTLSNQLSHLSSSVAQLISGGMNQAQQQQALAGLGLAGGQGQQHQQQQHLPQQNQFGTPQMAGGNFGVGGMRGDSNRMASPLIPNNSSSFVGSAPSPHLGPNGFPQGGGNRLSWGAAGSGVGGPGSVGGMNSPHLDGMPATSSRGLPKELADRRWSGMAQGGGPRSVVGLGEQRRDSYGTPNLDGSNASRFNEGGGVVGGNPTSASTASASGLPTKWENLPLHQDLLRSILKYGLGPPNKIQQRALPFLLRGNDIIAQAPPTQERIASYVIPALQLVLSTIREPNAIQFGLGKGGGPIALIISTTVDQATQAQRMVLGLGASLGIRVHIAAAASIDSSQEAIAVSQSQPHIIVGTPRKMSDLFQHLVALNNSGTTLALSPSGTSTSSATNPIDIKDVRLVVLDEADQLIARNLSDHVSTLLKLLPLPRSLGQSSLNAIGGGGSASSINSPMISPRLPPASINNGSEASSNQNPSSSTSATMDRQTAIFSNTVPQDVLNFAQSIHLRESVRVLVRREGSVLPTSSSNPSGNGSNGGGGSGGSAPIPISGGGNSSFLQSNQQRDSLSTSQPSNALGSSPMNSNSTPISDPILSSLKGLRQYYLYVAVSTPSSLNSPNPSGMMMNGSRMNHHETEMKLDVITDLLEDMEFGQLVIYTANANTTELVTYKLASRGIEALALHRDMAQQTRSQTISKFRSPNSSFPTGLGTPNLNGPPRGRKALVVHDLVLNPKEVHQIPLIVFYDLPRSVEEYKEKIACAASNGFSRPSVCVNVVTASGGPRGDIEMLRTLECHLGCKMAELPMDPKSILNF